MQAARRLYLYLMSGIGLGVLLGGVATFLAWALGELGLERIDPYGVPAAIPREQLSLAGALLVVGGLVWGVHWWVAQRSVGREHAGVAADRQSGLRALYFAAVLGASATWIALSALDLLMDGVYAIVGRPEWYRFDPAAALAGLLAGGVAFGFHARVRIEDGRRVELHGAAAWWTRLYRYAAAFAGGALALIGWAWLAETVMGLAFGTIAPGSSSGWPERLAAPIAMIGVGVVLWLGHAAYSARRAADRGTRLRTTYLAAALAGGLAGAITHLGRAVAAPVAGLLGVERAVLPAALLDGTNGILAAVIAGLAAAVVFGVVALLHRRGLLGEAGRGDAAEPAARRIDATAVALVGLAYAAVAAARLVGAAIAVGFGGATFTDPDGPRVVVAEFMPIAAVATPVWLWGWARMERRRATDPEAEARSTVRRSALLGVMAVAIVSGISSLALILYRTFDAMLGGSAVDLVAELSTPIGAVFVVLAVLTYHAVLLWRDMVRAGGRLLPGAAEASQREAVELVLVGPPQHLLETLEELRRALPPGYRLDPAPRPPGRLLRPMARHQEA